MMVMKIVVWIFDPLPSRMTTVVECWNDLAGNVDILSSWVMDKDSKNLSGNLMLQSCLSVSTVVLGENSLSIEMLETQLINLKRVFAEKQKLVSDLETLSPKIQNIITVKSDS